ncbi:MAG: transposase [Oligoflexales bacterium]|nr:transposase [Oligoflexales bacterium]
MKNVSPNYRNGSCERNFLVRDVRDLKIKIPCDRKGEYSSKLIEKYDRYDKALEKDLSLLFLSGLSTRNISLISQTLIGRKISAAEVSKVNKELSTGIDAWRLRSLEPYKIEYLYVDGVFFYMRVDYKIENSDGEFKCKDQVFELLVCCIISR